MYGKQARLLWSLSGSGLGTTISGDGDSGDWGYAQNTGSPRSAVSLAQDADVALYVSAAGVAGTGTPTLTVTLGAFDGLGNLFPSLITVTGLTADGSAGAQYISGGLHTSPGLVLPLWGQVAWAVSGTDPVFTGVEIALYGR